MEAFRTAPGDAREDFRWRPDPGEGPQTPDTTVSNDGVPQHCVGVLSHLRQLLLSESFVDVTLCCLGGSLRAHRVLLSACSPYLQRLLLDHPSADHTTIILADVQRDDMGALLQFIYTGSVSVPRERLGSFLLTAEALQVKVLKDMPCMPGSGGHLPVDVKVSVGDETSSPGGSLRQPCCPPPPSAMDPSTSAPAAFDSATTGKQPPSRGQALGCGLLPSLAGPERGYLHDMPLPPHLQPPPPSLLSTHLPTHLPGLPPHLAFAPPLGLHPGLPSGLPLPPPELWSRPLHGLPPSLPPPVPLAPSPTSAQSSSFPDGWPPDRAKAEREERADRTDSPEPHAGAQTGAQAGLRPAMTSIVTPSPWLQSRRPPMRPGARTPIRPHASRLQAPPPPPSPSLSPTAVRPAPLSPAAPPAKPTPSREALPRPTTPRRASVVPKKRMSPGAEAYCFREQLGSTTSMTPPPGASSASSAGSALNLCVPKTSPAASPVLQQALEAAPPPLSPMTPSAAAATAPSCKPAPAFHDPNNNHTGTGHGLGCAAPAGPAMPHRPIATRPDPGAFLANGFLAAPTPLPGLPPLPGLDAGETTIKCEVVELDTVAELPADAAVKEEESDGGASPAKAHCCEVCGKRFSRRQLLVQHRRVHTGERPYTCGACGKQFSQRGHWSTHQKLHEPTRAAEHTCESCGKAFVTKASLKVHMRTHTGEKPFRCAECGKTFSQLRNFKYHRSVHEGTREFAATCPECGKLFNDRGYLSSHMKIHRNRKEYGCEFCGKSFNQRVAYNMHVRIHTGEKPHQCPTCGKTFSRKMLLKQHLRIHTGEKPFSCTVCGKCFADRSNMTLHMRLHSGEKPYQCTVCCKSFTKKHHLKTHINYHTGLKPYSCSKCGLSFSQSSNMRTHQKKCNGPPPGGIVPAAVPAVPSPSGGGVTLPTGSPSPLRPLTPAVGPTSQAEPAASTPAEGKAVLGRPLRLTPSPTASEASSRHLVISPEQQVRLAPAMEAPTC